MKGKALQLIECTIPPNQLSIIGRESILDALIGVLQHGVLHTDLRHCRLWRTALIFATGGTAASMTATTTIGRLVIHFTVTDTNNLIRDIAWISLRGSLINWLLLMISHPLVPLATTAWDRTRSLETSSS